MKLQKLLDRLEQSELYAVTETADVSKAARTLNEKKVGALLVFDEAENFVGIVSERDILRLCEDPSNEMDQLQVQQIMTPREKVVTLTVSNKLDEALNVMLKHRIRHLPVFSGEDIVGVVSMRDVVRTLWHQARYKNQALQRYISNATLPNASEMEDQDPGLSIS